LDIFHFHFPVFSFRSLGRPMAWSKKRICALCRALCPPTYVKYSLRSTRHAPYQSSIKDEIKAARKRLRRRTLKVRREGDDEANDDSALIQNWYQFIAPASFLSMPLSTHTAIPVLSGNCENSRGIYNWLVLRCTTLP
jgi:hypothetical protein